MDVLQPLLETRRSAPCHLPTLVFDSLSPSTLLAVTAVRRASQKPQIPSWKANLGNDTTGLDPRARMGSVGLDQAPTSVFAGLKENGHGFQAIWQALVCVWYRFQGQRRVMTIFGGSGIASPNLSRACVVVSIAVSCARAILSSGFCGDRNGLG